MHDAADAIGEGTVIVVDETEPPFPDIAAHRLDAGCRHRLAMGRADEPVGWQPSEEGLSDDAGGAGQKQLPAGRQRVGRGHLDPTIGFHGPSDGWRRVSGASTPSIQFLASKEAETTGREDALPFPTSVGQLSSFGVLWAIVFQFRSAFLMFPATSFFQIA